MLRFYGIFRYLLLFTLSLSLLSALEISDLKKDASRLQGLDNSGTEFWFSVPPCNDDEVGTANYVKIFVISTVRTLVTVEVPGKGFSKTIYTIPNEVNEINLSPSAALTWTKKINDLTPFESVYQGAGVHLYSGQNVVAYCVVRYHQSSEGFLLIPSSSLGKEYIITSAKVDAMFNAFGNKMPATTCITSPYSSNKVRFTLGGNVLTKTIAGMSAGNTKEWTLNRGDVLVVSADAGESDLTGSKIESSKPVSVVTGNYCANIPTGNQWCNYTVEMDNPTYLWGMKCHVGRIPGRKFASEVKISAKEAYTKIYRNGLNIGTIQQFGGVEGKGYFYMRMTADRKPGSSVFSGDKPINVTLLNAGTQEDGYPNPNTNPFLMNTIPDEQMQKEIMFGTPGIPGGLNFPENFINLIYQTDSLGMMPDHFEFAGPINGKEIEWVRLNTKFPGKDELFSYDINGKKYALKTITLPGDGVYRIRAKTAFGAYSFGFSRYDSYGFPASANLNDMVIPDTVCPVPTFTVGCDGTVDDGFVTDMPDDSTVRSNLAIMYLLPDSSFNYELRYEAIESGITRSTKWYLKVIDQNNDAKAYVSFVDRRGNDTTIIIDYFAKKISVKSANCNFGEFAIGESLTLDFFLCNNSHQSSETINALVLKQNTKFELITENITFPITIGRNDSVKFQVKFTADAYGIFKDTILVTDDCSTKMKSFLIAQVGKSTIFVSDVSFDKVYAGDKAVSEFIIRNEGEIDLFITGYKGPDDSVLTTDLGIIDNEHPLILKPGEMKKYNITFSPKTALSINDKIVFTSNADTNRKNYCYISAISTPVGIYASSYDWGKRRVYSYYPSEQSNPAITIKNQRTEAVTIDDFSVLSNTRGNAFEFDIAAIKNGFTLKPDSSISFPVVFHPVELGIHRLILSFTNSQNAQIISELRGVGVSPKLATFDYNFDTTGINSTKEKIRRTIKFRNMEYSTDTSVSDTVTIFDFNISDPLRVNTLEDKYNPNAWYFDKTAIGLPKVLNPKDSLIFDAFFVAQIYGNQNVDIGTISSALNETTSHWVGAGGINTGIPGLPELASNLLISPNPMNAAGGEISFRLAGDGFTRIALYSMNGELVEVLLSQYMERGEHKMHFDTGKLSSGVYKVLISQNSTKLEKSLYLVK